MSTPNPKDSAEKLRMQEAEGLAKYAIEESISARQIRALYGIVRSKGLYYIF